MMKKELKTYVSPEIVVICAESFRLLSNSNDEWTGDNLGKGGDFDFDDTEDDMWNGNNRGDYNSEENSKTFKNRYSLK